MLPPIIHDRVFYFLTEVEAAYAAVQDQKSASIYRLQEVMTDPRVRARILEALNRATATAENVYIWG